MTSSPSSPTRAPDAVIVSRTKLFSAVTGVTAVVVLLQGLWAGIFLVHDGGRDAAESWINVHSWGSNLAQVLAVAGLAITLIWLRTRKDLIYGSAVLLVLMVVESVLGTLIKDQHQDTLTAVHIPLAMVIMGLVVWLPLRGRSRGAAITP